MDNIVDITKNKPLSKEAIKLFNFGTAIDDLILQHLKEGYDPAEIAVLMGHRTGELLKRVEDKEGIIITVVEVMKTRAGVK